MVYGFLEKALHLSGMKIHGYHAVSACQLYALCAHSAAYRHSGLVLLIALGIAEIGDNGGNTVCAGALECVQEEKQLCKFIVGIKSYSLYEVYVLVPYALIDADEGVAFGEYVSSAFAHRASEIIAHLCCKFFAGAARKNFNGTVAGHFSIYPLLIFISIITNIIRIINAIRQFK